MNHESEHIDEVFKQRLQHAAPMPPAFVWDNIKNELKKRKKRPLIWIFTLSGALLCAIGAWLVFAQPFKAEELSTAVNEKPAVMELPQPAISTPATPSSTLNSEPADKPVKRQINTITTEEKAGPKGRHLSQSLSMPLPSNTSREGEMKGFSLKFTNNQPDATELKPLKAEPQKTIFSNNNTQAGFALSMLPVQDIRLLAMEQEDPVVSKQPQQVTEKARKAKSKRAVRNCYDFTKQPKAWMLEAYIGPDIAQRSLVTTYDNQPYLNKRLSTEKRNFAFNAGLRASLILNGNFLLRSGLHYDQAVEVFEYIDPDEVITDVRHVYDPATGQTRLDTIGIYYGEKYQKTFNRYGMLDIPLTLGFEMRKGRSGFNLNAGMSLNVLFWKRGAILSPAVDAPAWFTPGKEGALNVFKKNTGISAMASLQWFYHLNPRWRIFVEPTYRKILRPVSLPSHPVQQSYGFANLRIGVCKILN